MNRGRPDGGPVRSKALLRAPAMQAVFIQLGAFLLVLGFAHAAALLTDLQLTVAVAALLQGVLAASVSRLFGLASWWLAIQSMFPIALIAALSLQLPPVIFLIAFLALLCLYWSTFRTQVPFYPSGPAAWKAAEQLLPQGRPLRVIDIGSGLGGLVLHLARARRDCAFTGIEIAPLPWIVSVLRARIGGSSARFVRGDYERFDFAACDVVFAYLSPAAMPALWHKAKSEMRAGSLLLSYEFDIPGIAPHVAVMPKEGGPRLYGWYL